MYDSTTIGDEHTQGGTRPCDSRGGIVTNQTRRRFIGAAAGVSAAALGLPAFVDRGRAYTDTATVTAGTPVPYTVEWRSEYNGAVVESSDPGTRLPLQAGHVLPGDSGAVVFRVRPKAPNGGSTYVTASFDDGNPTKRDVLVNAENGVNGPELDAGDGPDEDVGELLDAIGARVWYDVGVLGMSALGGCDGTVDTTETLVDGSLRDVTNRLSDGIGIPANGCLGPDESACFGFEWSLDVDVGNLIQGDSVDFPLALVARECGSR